MRQLMEWLKMNRTLTMFPETILSTLSGEIPCENALQRMEGKRIAPIQNESEKYRWQQNNSVSRSIRIQHRYKRNLSGTKRERQQHWWVRKHGAAHKILPCELRFTPKTNACRSGKRGVPPRVTWINSAINQPTYGSWGRERNGTNATEPERSPINDKKDEPWTYGQGTACLGTRRGVCWCNHNPNSRATK